MGAIEDHNIYGLTIRESANDGSDFTNPDADYRRVFLGEDGEWHSKDSAGSVTGFAGSGIADQGTITYLDATEAAAPATPASGKVRVYAKSDGLLYSKDDAGVEALVSEGVWAAFTPTITASGGGFDIGNGTLVGRIKNMGGGLYAVRVYFEDGSTTAEGTGTYTWGGFGITTVAGSRQVLSGFLLDSGTRYYVAGADFGASASTCGVRVADSGTLVGATTPVTLATGDAVWFQGILEAA